jgi:hypothetical protein
MKIKIKKSKIDKIVDEWAKKHRWDYDCYKEQINDLKEMLKKKKMKTIKYYLGKSKKDTIALLLAYEGCLLLTQNLIWSFI